MLNKTDYSVIVTFVFLIPVLVSVPLLGARSLAPKCDGDKRMEHPQGRTSDGDAVS
ncbi:hypothetical protein H1P_860002 [Hyella patelloides LEGE 07179]|uniref:Uncharacterized protein n=1 Tax=Hyella patelloides LEGE 07179 TaxID=945734 RepID=A0A563W4T7_9CYAN|nr:hypothetical protein H1P_860002 [Hyella patelloides LEGE 07179]